MTPLGAKLGHDCIPATVKPAGALAAYRKTTQDSDVTWYGSTACAAGVTAAQLLLALLC